MVILTKPIAFRWLSQWWGRGWLVLLSLGLHGLLLGTPMPNAEELEEPVTRSPSTEVIDVVQMVDRVSLSPPKPKPTVQPQSVQPPEQASPGQARSLATLPAPSQVPQPPAQPAVSEQLPAPPEPPISPGADLPTSAPLEVADSTPGLVYNHQVKSLHRDTQSFVSWYTEQSWEGLDPLPLPGQKELAALLVNYTQSTCLVPPPAPGRLEVIVNPDGTLVRPARILASTGYDALDGMALTQAAQQNFTSVANPALPSPTVYWLPVEIRYNPANCSH